MKIEYGGLRRLGDKDKELMLEWMHDDRVNRNFRFDFGSMTLDRAERFISGSFTPENQNFAFVDENDAYLGTISLKNISQKDSNAEYAIVARTLAWGTGVAYKATMDILKYAFDSLKLNRIYLNVLEENGRANRFYDKCGFQFEGKFSEHLYLRGEYKNLNWYGMSKRQFDQMRTA